MWGLGLGLALDSGTILGRAGTSISAGPAAPVLSMDPAWTSANSTPLFAFVIDDTIVVGDTITVQIRALGASGWGTLVGSGTHILTAPEDAANAFSFGLSSLADGNYEASSFAHHTVDGARSNVVSFTVAAGSRWQLEDASGLWQLEDGSGYWLLEA